MHIHNQVLNTEYRFFRYAFPISCSRSPSSHPLQGARGDRPLIHTYGGVLKINRAISTGQLHTLLRFHTRPINVVVFHGSQARPSFKVGFPLRCFQRLSLPDLATLLCRWRDNRSTRDPSTPVLSY